MSGTSNLKTLLKSISPKIQKGTYVFCTINEEQYKEISVVPKMTYQEKEGISIIITEKEAKGEKLDYEYTWSLITLNVHSDLDAIGFLAAILPKLGKEGISVNVISAYYHDHLFVPSEKKSKALKILEKFSE